MQSCTQISRFLVLLASTCLTAPGAVLAASIDINAVGANGEIGLDGGIDENGHGTAGGNGGPGESVTPIAFDYAIISVTGKGGDGGPGGNGGTAGVDGSDFGAAGAGGAGGHALAAASSAGSSMITSRAYGGRGGEAGSTFMAGGSGGRGGGAAAAAEGTGAHDLTIEAQAEGGAGGGGGEANGGAGGAATLGTVSGVSTGGGTVAVTGSAIGGAGGPAFSFGYQGSGGAGGEVTLNNKVDGATRGNLILSQSATGGAGGFALDSGYGGGGAGGSASSRLSRSFAGQNDKPANLTMDAAATGGAGGDANTYSASGGAGGDATASAGAAGSRGRSLANATATSGTGGDGGVAGAASTGGKGGNAIATSFASSDDNAEANAVATGGTGGNDYYSGVGGNGGRAAAASSALGTHTATAHATATGGGGGAGGYLFNGTDGTATATATAEAGGPVLAPSARPSAKSVAIADSAQIGTADTTARVVGGLSGSVTAATDHIQGIGVTKAESAVNVGGPLTRASAAAAAGLNGAAYATALPAAAELSGVVLGHPNIQTVAPGAMPLGFVTLGGARSVGFTGNDVHTYGSSVSFSVDLSRLGTGDLVIGLLDPTFGTDTAQPFQSLTLTVSEDGAALSRTFTSCAAARSFFHDGAYNLGSGWRSPGETSLDLTLQLSIVTDAPGQAFYADALIGFRRTASLPGAVGSGAPESPAPVPLPGALWLLGTALGGLGLLGRRGGKVPAAA